MSTKTTLNLWHHFTSPKRQVGQPTMSKSLQALYGSKGGLTTWRQEFYCPTSQVAEGVALLTTLWSKYSAGCLPVLNMSVEDTFEAEDGTAYSSITVKTATTKKFLDYLTKNTKADGGIKLF